MGNGWIKLHQRVIDNEIWRNDRTAWHVFEYLLLKAYSGKPQGTVVTSRYQIADMVGGNNNTIYKALKRLEKAKMVTMEATNKRTTIYICNWQEYQSGSNHAGNNKVTTKQQQSNTLNRIKNKEHSSNKNYGKPEINELFEQWEKIVGYPINQKIKANRQACWNLYRKHGTEALLVAMKAVASSQADRYAPTVSDFVQLQAKLDDLRVWLKKNNREKGVIKI